MFENSLPAFKKNSVCFLMEKKIDSRKNNIFLVKNNNSSEKDKYLVYKKYSQPEKMPREIEMLSLLKKRRVPVPQIYDTGKDYALMEYMEGPLFLDFFCWQENAGGYACNSLKGLAYQTIYSLCSWFKDFYAASKEATGKQLIMGNVNFRNFIIREKIYGIDLEECREGKIEEDIGSLCAFALTYSPSFTSWKMAMAGELFRVLSSELDLDKELLKREIQKGLRVIAARRKRIDEMLKLQAFNIWQQDTFFV